MYTKVMICDDELLARNKIRSLLDWEKYGYYICAEADNGEHAISLIRETRPHILLTDIDMPILDGVSLCRYLNEHHSDIKLIVLSNYDHFDYVHDTMQNGAVEYLLKHRVNKELLLDVLHKAQARPVDYAARSFLSQSAAETLKSHIEADMFAKLIESDMPEQLKPFSTNTCVVCVQLLQDVQLQDERAFDHNEVLVHSMVALCQQIIGNTRSSITLHEGDGLFLILLAYPELRSEVSMLQSVQAYMDKLKKTIWIVYRMAIETGHSSVCHHIQELGNYIEHAHRELASKLRTKGNLPESDIELPPGQNNADVGLTIQQEKELLNAIVAYNKPHIKTILGEVFDSFQQRKKEYSQMILLVEELINYAHRIGRKSTVDVKWISEEIRENRPKISQWTEVRQWVAGIYIRLVDEINASQSHPSYSKYVEKAMKLVRTKYYEGVSLEQAADAIGITPSYLSKLFKEETGKSYTETVNHYRIELSKQYIQNGKANIKEIYSIVGFNNYPYFFKVFKDIVGETPQAYARRNNNKQ
ncbi:response regulator [Paenibacillaceae bacterium]|nr:response regulator [Paenibacillaceae bacterium]